MIITGNKENWQIDVPVAVNFFARPDTFKQVFEIIKQAKPRQLFLIADGPRDYILDDIENCKACREIADNIDWNCEVYHFYNDKNKGLFKTYFDSMTEVFKIVDRCIFLEDDLVVSKSFFKYCKDLLEKYEKDLRIHFITGMNVIGKYDAPDGDYFFSGEGSIWGYALWKRTFDSMNLSFRENKYAIEMTKQVARQIKPGYEKKIEACVDNPEWQGHIPHVEFYKNFLRFSQNQIYIVPKVNLVSNIGVSSNAVHVADDIRKLPKITQKLFNSRIYELEFPLHEPEFMIRDLYYEKQVNYMLAWNRPVLKFTRRVEALFRHMIYGDFKRIFSKGGAIAQRKFEGVKRMDIQTIDRKLISVVIPIYNVEKYLPRCLDSLLAQTYSFFEVLLIDDGSTDGSYKVAEEYCAKDGRLKLFHQENSGQGAARNLGIANANGEYLAFVDSDDWVNSKYLETLLGCAQANDADIVMCGVERVWENGTRRINPISNNKEYIIEDKDNFLKKASFVIWDKLFKKELFYNLEFPKGIKFEDFALTPQVLCRADVIVGIPDVLYYYFWRSDSTTNKVKVNRDILTAYQILKNSEFANKYPDIMEVYFVRMVLGSLIWALQHYPNTNSEIKNIMKEAKEQHSDIYRKIKKGNLSSPFWGRLIYNEHYLLARMYVLINDCFRSIIRRVIHSLPARR